MTVIQTIATVVTVILCYLSLCCAGLFFAAWAETMTTPPTKPTRTDITV